MSITRFLIGDSVTVVKAMPEWEYWIPYMTDFVGETGRVVDFEEANDDVCAMVEFDTNGVSESFFFPDGALRYAYNESLSPTMSVFDLAKGGSRSEI